MEVDWNKKIKFKERKKFTALLWSILLVDRSRSVCHSAFSRKTEPCYFFLSLLQESIYFCEEFHKGWIGHSDLIPYYYVCFMETAWLMKRDFQWTSRKDLHTIKKGWQKRPRWFLRGQFSQVYEFRCLQYYLKYSQAQRKDNF